MEHGAPDRRPRINLRPLVFCAFGLIFGIFLYMRIRFGGLRPSDFLFCALFLGFSLVPFSLRRTGAIVLAVVLFGGIGAAATHLYTENFQRGAEEGNYTVTGTVCSFTVKNGYTEALLEDLSFDGVPAGGKLSVNLSSEEVRAGDIVTFEAFVTRNGLPMSADSYAEYLFYSDIRYTSSNAEYERAGERGVLLRLQSALYDRLSEGMGKAEAEVAYALLTGNSRGMDEGLLDEVRRGGIAHIFAVSGLHIGILFGAAMLIFRKPCKRYAFVPASLLALLYAAFCAFSVSSVRAVVMCAAVGAQRAFGRKSDFLQSISLAAIVVLLLDPADFLSAGFRLSFGACLGLALFSGPLSRAIGHIPHLPRAVRSYLSANLSVQLFTLPLLLDAFGYVSLWGFLLNLALIPLLPVFFLTVLIFSLLALAIAPAATFFLAAPEGLVSLFLAVIAFGDLSFVLTGFSLGAGGVVWLSACLILSERFRLAVIPRLSAAAVLAAVFALCIAAENLVVSGGRIYVYARDDQAAALIRTAEANVLIVDGEIGVQECEEFLARRYGGELDAVIVLADDELSAVNHAAFLPARCIYARDEIPTGLNETDVCFGETFCVGGMRFTFLTREKLAIEAEGVTIEADLNGSPALGADLFLGGADGGLKFSFQRGIIKAI